MKMKYWQTTAPLVLAGRQGILQLLNQKKIYLRQSILKG